MRLGVNGFGRIGKLTLWHHIARKYADEIVVNIGRNVGRSLDDIAHYLERDSTYGSLSTYLYGHRAGAVVEEVNEKAGTILVDGTRIHFLRETRNPSRIRWSDKGVRLVVDTTGQFLDRTASADDPKGALTSGSRCREGDRIRPFQDPGQEHAHSRRCRDNCHGGQRE